MVRIKRGDIVLASLEPVVGSEQGSTRPVLIIQNDIGNETSPVTIIAPLTSRIYEKDFPTNVFLPREDSNLDKDSTILLNQIMAIDKSRIVKKLSTLDNFLMSKVDMALKICLALN